MPLTGMRGGLGAIPTRTSGVHTPRPHVGADHAHGRTPVSHTSLAVAPLITDDSSAGAPSVRIQPARPRLSAREVEILTTWLVCDTKADVAEELFVTDATVRTHLARIRAKYRDVGRPAATKIGLLIRAIEDGYCTLDGIARRLDQLGTAGNPPAIAVVHTPD